MSLEDKIVVLAETIGTDVRELINGKVDKELGKGLSDTNFTQAEKDKLASLENYSDTNPFTDVEKTKLNDIAAEATKNRADSENADKKHTHELSDVNGLDTALESKASKTELTDGLALKVDKVVGKDLSDSNYTQAEKDKLNSVADEATKNLPDATLLARENHTGTQAINTVAGLQAALDAAAESSGISAEDLARLVAVEDTLPHKADLEGGKLALSQMPDIAAGRKITVADEATRLTLDTWPDLTIAYQLADGSAYALDANDDPSVLGNWSMLGSGIADGVGSFNSRTGNVLPQTGDYTAAQIAESATKQFVTADQKAEWAAKETVVGAQAKATAAGQDAKEYADLTFIEKTQKGAADGVATLDATGKVPATQLKLKTINGEAITGEGDLAIEVDEGIEEAPLDGKQYARKNAGWIEVEAGDWSNPMVETPTITYPIEGEVGTAVQPTVTSSAFNPLDPTDTLAAMFFRFQIDGVTIHTSPKLLTTMYTPEAGVLDGSAEYDVSVMHIGDFSGQSGWSTPISFTTMPITIVKPIIEDPLNNAVDVPEQPVFKLSEFIDLAGVAVFDKAVFIVRDSVGTIIHTSPEQSGYTYALPAGILEEGELTYTVEGYLKSVGHGVSETSDPVTFTTMLEFASPYGLRWDSTQAVGGYTRLGDPYYTAIQSRMKRCVLLADGTVNYYLGPTDSTKKEDGSSADLTGASGNVMVEIPKFYAKYDNTVGAKEMWVSEKPEDGFEVHPAFIKNGVEVDYRYYRAYTGSVSGTKLISRSGVSAAASETITAFRAKARANGAGWGLVDWHLLHAVQTLLFIEIGTFDSQAMLGNGNDTGSDYGMTTGGSNSIGNGNSPSTNDDTWMSYRGIENFYADIFEFIDGINVSDRLVYISNTESTFDSDVFSGDYVSTGVTLPSTNGYIKDMDFSINGFIPTESGGSDSTYVPDRVFSGTGARVVLFGGHAGHGLHCGAASLYASAAVSHSSAAVGAGLSF